jgi:hypothetical protein
MTNSEALEMAIAMLEEQRAGYEISVKTSKSIKPAHLPPIVRKHRLKYEKLGRAIAILRKMQKKELK